MYISNIIFLLFSLSAFTANEPQTVDLHKYHLSKTLIEYNEQEQAIQISMHLFIDDLEDALRIQGVDKLFICTKKEAENAETEMEKYISQNFQLVINDQSMNYSFIGKEPAEDLMGVWCYLEITNVAELKNIRISNNLLLEAFDDQKNVTQVVGPKSKGGYFIFQKGKSSDKVTF